METFKFYIGTIYKLRYFWFYLARSDVIARFRRSKMGLLWIVLNPLLMTCIIAVIFGSVFEMPLGTYAPYVLSGLITWEAITSSIVAGGNAFFSSAQYIRQFNHPLLIYSLKSALVYSFNFLVALTALAIWIAFIAPKNLILALLSLPLTIVLLFFLFWPMITIAAFVNTKFRDYPQIAVLSTQMIYFVSPVFLDEGLFKGGGRIAAWFQINPITHILSLVRQPFLHGRFPSCENYLVVILCITVLSLIAIWLNKKFGKTIIFYL